MLIIKNMPLNWYSTMKKKIGKIWTIFDIENWLWKLEIGTFRSLYLECMLIFQKTIKMKKCCLSINEATISFGSCQKILKLYLILRYLCMCDALFFGKVCNLYVMNAWYMFYLMPRLICKSWKFKMRKNRRDAHWLAGP